MPCFSSTLPQTFRTIFLRIFLYQLSELLSFLFTVLTKNSYSFIIHYSLYSITHKNVKKLTRSQLYIYLFIRTCCLIEIFFTYRREKADEMFYKLLKYYSICLLYTSVLYCLLQSYFLLTFCELSSN